MSLIYLPTATVTAGWEDYDDPQTFHHLKAPVDAIHFRAVDYTRKRWSWDEDMFTSRTLNLDITLGRDLTITERAELPPGYIYDRISRVLSRHLIHDNINPETGRKWASMKVTIEAGENPLISTDGVLEVGHTDTAGYVLDEKRAAYVYPHQRPRIVMPVPPTPLDDLMGNWKTAPVSSTRTRLYGAFNNRVKRNSLPTFTNAFFPAKLKPAIEPQRTGRVLVLAEDKNRPVHIKSELMASPAPRFPFANAEHWGFLTLGVRDDLGGYRPFRAPDFMASPLFAECSTNGSALPINRVMIYRSPRAYHLLYSLVAMTEVGPNELPCPMLWSIPIVIKADEVRPEPDNLRGLPLSTLQELWKMPGLTNALKRGLNELHGEMVRLRKEQVDLTRVDYDMVDLMKPTYHNLATLTAWQETPAYYMNTATLPTFLATVQSLCERLAGGEWGHPLLIPEGSESAVQPVATETARLLDL